MVENIRIQAKASFLKPLVQQEQLLELPQSTVGPPKRT